jgi:hypothetical protein
MNTWKTTAGWQQLVPLEDRRTDLYIPLLLYGELGLDCSLLGYIFGHDARRIEERCIAKLEATFGQLSGTEIAVVQALMKDRGLQGVSGVHQRN